MGEVIRLMLLDTKNIFKMEKYHVRGTGGGGVEEVDGRGDFTSRS